MRDTWMTIVASSGAKLYSLLASVAVLLVTARLLGPSGRGEVAILQTWVTLFATVGYLSLGQVALYRMASDGGGHGRFGVLLGSLLTMATVMSICGWVVAVGAYLFSNFFGEINAAYLVVAFAALPFLIWELYGSALLTGIQMLTIYNRYQVIGRSCMILVVLILVAWVDYGVIGVLFGILIGQVVVSVGGIRHLFQYAREKRQRVAVERNEIRGLVAGGAKLHLNAIGNFMFSSASILVVQNYYESEQVGHLQLATQLVGAFMVLPTAVSMVLFGKVANIGPDGAWPSSKKLVWQITVLMAFIAALAAALAPHLILVIVGDAFLPAVALFQWMLIGLIGMAFSTAMAPQWIGRGLFWQAASLSIALGMLNLSLNIWLVPEYGLDAAAGVFVATYLVAAIVNGAMYVYCDRIVPAGHSGSAQ